MKKLILFVLMVLLISGCSQVKESLYDAVDPEDKSQIEIIVTPGMMPGELGSLLSDEKLVSNALAFTNYLKERGLDASLQEGRFLLSPSMNMEELVDTLITPVGSDTIILTIPEGYEVRNIVELLKSENMIDEKRFYELLEKGDFPYEFLKGLDRSYHLEGFLFPDTYEFFLDATEEEIIDKFLANFDSKFQDKYYKRMEELSMDLQGIINLASIIEREAADSEERSIISSVFHNRLEDEMMLQSCATVQYILQERKPILSYEDMAIESDYNTYINVGLPPAPIANPGLASIEAALYPADTNYLFFVLKGDNETTHYFSETFEEHEENILRSQEEDEGNE